MYTTHRIFKARNIFREIITTKKHICNQKDILETFVAYNEERQPQVLKLPKPLFNTKGKEKKKKTDETPNMLLDYFV